MATSSASQPRPPVLIALVTAAVYFAAAKFGLSLGVVEQVTVIWPASGIALAAVLLFGWSACPGIALGAFAANATANEPLVTAAGIALGNTLEAAVGAALLRRAGVRPTFDRLRDVVALVVTALVSTPLSAVIGVLSLVLGGVHPWTSFGTLCSVWWLGDTIGDLLVAPLLLLWADAPPPRLRGPRAAEVGALASGTIGVALVVLAGRPGLHLAGYPLHYLIFPFVVWAAMRFGQRGTTAVTAVASAVAIWGTVGGQGPFAMGTVAESLVMLQLFMAVVAVTGLLLGAAIAERDAAEQRAVREYARLEMSEERLRFALEAGRLGVWDWDIQSGTVTWTENLETIHGLPPGSFSGTFEGFRALVHPDDREAVDRAVRATVEEGARYDIEFRNVWPDGSVRWMAAKGRVLRDAGGRPLRMIGTGMDVTEHHRLAEELRQRARQLADTDRRKDEFLAMLAHELRNPLAPLSTALHLLGTGGGDRDRFLGMAERGVKQLVRLVDDLLDVSRITQGKITLRRERVGLEDVVRRAVEMVRAQIDSRGHAFTISLPPEPVRLDADPARLAQVLANLLGNATKYTPPGGSIWLTGERVGDDLVLRVRDTGAGLAPELVPQIFDLFVQGDASLARTRGGLGIGLTIVRRLVELHGGRVEAHSAGLGHGSEFIVHLPVVPPAFDEAAAAGGAAAPAEGASGLRVLVVEDNQDAAEALAALLGLWGHESRVAFDGLAALEAAEQWAPDVILSDLGLPGMDGYELARRLRAHPAFGGVVLVALSGYGRDEDKRRALEAGFDHHLVKPPDIDALAELLGKVAAAPGERVPRTLH